MFFIKVLLLGSVVALYAIGTYWAWIQYLKDGEKPIVTPIVINLFFFAHIVLFCFLAIPCIRDLPAVIRHKPEKMTGTIVGYKVKHEEGRNTYLPIVENDSTGKRVVLSVVNRREITVRNPLTVRSPLLKDAVIDDVLSYGRYSFSYFKHTKIAIIEGAEQPTNYEIKP